MFFALHVHLWKEIPSRSSSSFIRLFLKPLLTCFYKNFADRKRFTTAMFFLQTFFRSSKNSWLLFHLTLSQPFLSLLLGTANMDAFACCIRIQSTLRTTNTCSMCTIILAELGFHYHIEVVKELSIPSKTSTVPRRVLFIPASLFTERLLPRTLLHCQLGGENYLLGHIKDVISVFWTIHSKSQKSHPLRFSFYIWRPT